MTLDYLGAQPPESAIPELYHQVARGHLFGSDSQSIDVDFQLNLRKHILRNENGHVVMVSNLIPISPSDVGFVLQAFYNKLEILMRSARGHEQALGVASWARHMITEIQAGVDCNTRAAQAVYNYVLARINVIHGTRYPLVDFWRAEVRDAYVTIPVNGIEDGFYIFSDGIKDYLNSTVLRDLDSYARAHGRRYLFFKNPHINTSPASTAAVVLDYNGDLYTVARYLEDFNLEEWHTHRDFVLEKIELVTLGQIVTEPVFKSEVAWIQNWMSGQVKTTTEKNTNPFGVVSRTLTARRATRNAAQQTSLRATQRAAVLSMGVAPTQIAGAPR